MTEETNTGVEPQVLRHAYGPDGDYIGAHIGTQAEFDAWSEGDYFAGDSPAPEQPTAEMVKAEANRRIVAVLPEWKQRNLTAQAALLAEKGRVNWTAAELADWNAGAALWAQVAAIRAASDALEALDPIPTDYRDDAHWVASED